MYGLFHTTVVQESGVNQWSKREYYMIFRFYSSLIQSLPLFFCDREPKKKKEFKKQKSWEQAIMNWKVVLLRDNILLMKRVFLLASMAIASKSTVKFDGKFFYCFFWGIDGSSACFVPDDNGMQLLLFYTSTYYRQCSDKDTTID